MSDDKSPIISKQNDEFRSFLWVPHFGIPRIQGKHLLTHGITSLSPEDQIIIIAKVRGFNDFNRNNDPYGEHDFGKFSHNQKDILWKIDYYDVNYEYGSEDPCNPSKTRRVLTVMLADEY